MVGLRLRAGVAHRRRSCHAAPSGGQLPAWRWSLRLAAWFAVLAAGFSAARPPHAWQGRRRCRRRCSAPSPASSASARSSPSAASRSASSPPTTSGFSTWRQAAGHGRRHRGRRHRRRAGPRHQPQRGRDAATGGARRRVGAGAQPSAGRSRRRRHLRQRRHRQRAADHGSHGGVAGPRDRRRTRRATSLVDAAWTSVLLAHGNIARRWC